MIKFSSSFKSNEIHIVDSPFNENPENIYIFSRDKLISGEERPGNLGKMGNNRDIYCFANRGWSISQNPCDASIFQHARPNFRKKIKKLNFQTKI